MLETPEDEQTPQANTKRAEETKAMSTNKELSLGTPGLLTTQLDSYPGCCQSAILTEQHSVLATTLCYTDLE